MNLRKKISRKPLDKDSENPALDRMKELERQMSALKKDVDTLKDLVVWPFSGDEDESREEKRKQQRSSTTPIYSCVGISLFFGWNRSGPGWRVVCRGRRRT
jgi:hypothetical protein